MRTELKTPLHLHHTRRPKARFKPALRKPIKIRNHPLTHLPHETLQITEPPSPSVTPRNTTQPNVPQLITQSKPSSLINRIDQIQRILLITIGRRPSRNREQQTYRHHHSPKPGRPPPTRQHHAHHKPIPPPNTPITPRPPHERNEPPRVSWRVGCLCGYGFSGGGLMVVGFVVGGGGVGVVGGDSSV